MAQANKYRVQIVNTTVMPGTHQNDLAVDKKDVGKVVTGALDAIEQIGHLRKVKGPWSMIVVIEHLPEVE